MNWGNSYQLPNSNYMGFGAVPANMNVGGQQTPMDQFNMAANAANFAQLNQQRQLQQQMQQQMMSQLNQRPMMNQPMSGFVQPSQQSNYSASWPMDEGSNGPGQSNTGMGLFDTSSNVPSNAVNSLQAQLSHQSNQDDSEQSMKLDGKDDRAKANESQEMRRPQGHGWPKDRPAGQRGGYQSKKFHENKRTGKKQEAKSKDSKCPICQKMIPLDNWVSHATSHAGPAEDNARMDESEADYLFIHEVLKNSMRNSELINEFSCQLCNLDGLEFEEMVRHVQDAEHMHLVYRWISLPSTIGHERYKEHIPDIPIKSRHHKFHFCELCLKLAGWHDVKDVAKHVDCKPHLTKVQKLREDLQWVKKGYEMRNEGSISNRMAEDRQLPEPERPRNINNRMGQLPPQRERPRNINNMMGPPQQEEPMFEQSRGSYQQQRQFDMDDVTRNQPMSNRNQFQPNNNQQYVSQPQESLSGGRLIRNVFTPTQPNQGGNGGQMEKYHGGMGLANNRESSSFGGYGREQGSQLGGVHGMMKNPLPLRNEGMDAMSSQQRYFVANNNMDTTNRLQEQGMHQDNRRFDGGGQALQRSAYRQSPERPTVLNRGKLQEIVHSIRSTSAGETRQSTVNVDAEAARSKAAVLAMLKGGNSTDVDRKYRQRSLEQGSLQSSDYLSERDRAHPDEFLPGRRSATPPFISPSDEKFAYSKKYDDQSTPFHSAGQLDHFLERRDGLSERPLEADRRSLDQRSYSPSRTSYASKGDMGYSNTQANLFLEGRPVSPERRKDSPGRRRGASTERQRGGSPVRRKSPGRRKSPDRRKSSDRRSLDRRRYSPERLRVSPSRRKMSPERRRRSLERRGSSVERHRGSPSRRRYSPGRHGRGAEKSRHLESKPRSDHFSRDDSLLSHKRGANDPIDITSDSIKKQKRRLSPLVLDAPSREALTKRIEVTWQKYYHKYYSCVVTNPEIVLELQKEYLRSYKGFFKEDPYFELYYTKVAKPEDLREALTLRIDRKSPGPDPSEAQVNDFVDPALHNLSSGYGNKPVQPMNTFQAPQSTFASSAAQVSTSTNFPAQQNSHIVNKERQAPTTRSEFEKKKIETARSKNYSKSDSSSLMEKRNVSSQNKTGKPSLPPPTGTNRSTAAQRRGPSPLPPPNKPSPVKQSSASAGERHNIAPEKLPVKSDSLKGESTHSTSGGIFPEASHIVTNEEQKRLARENRFKEREEQSSISRPLDKGTMDNTTNLTQERFKERNSQTMDRSQNDPIITSTTQGFPAERKRIQGDGDASKGRSVLGRLGPQRKESSSSSRDHRSSSGYSKESSSREHRRNTQIKEYDHEEKSSARRSTSKISERLGPSASKQKPSSETALTEMFSDPFLAFVHKTLTGIILIGQYQESMAKSSQPEQLLAKINAEQEEMQARMVTEDGHLLIQLARCCVEDPAGIEKTFPAVSPDLGPILRNLDKQVVSLIADTPIIINHPPKPSH